jgi:protein-tyrosine phosphatase
MNLLFICSRNKRRSLTAEAIYKNSSAHNVRSAGTGETARIQVSEKMLLWADIIFVMEKRHKQLLEQRFENALHDKQVVVLDIPDEYDYMDEDLIGMLKDAVEYFVK